jgi:sporulation protein YlmC with PRC-barrel domain
LSFRRGAKVYALDGKIGQVDEFMVSPEDHQITHLMLREGHLWGKKLVIIPVSKIDRVEENQIFLRLDKLAVEALPVIPIKRHFF